MNGEQCLIGGDAEGIGGDLKDQGQDTQAAAPKQQTFDHQAGKLARRFTVLGWVDITAQNHAGQTSDTHAKSQAIKNSISPAPNTERFARKVAAHTMD